MQIRAIDRKQEVPHDGPMCDLLWSDPEGECSQAAASFPSSHTQELENEASSLPDQQTHAMFVKTALPFCSSDPAHREGVSLIPRPSNHRKPGNETEKGSDDQVCILELAEWKPFSVCHGVSCVHLSYWSCCAEFGASCQST